MFDKKIKSYFFLLTLSALVLTLLLIVTNFVFAANLTFKGNEKANLIFQGVNLLWFQLIAFVLLLIILSLSFFLFYKKFSVPMIKIKSVLKDIGSNLSDTAVDLEYEDTDEFINVINEIAFNIKQNHDKLEYQSAELYDKNWELQEANSELEASYSQLQAIIEQLNEAEQKYHSLVKNIPEVVCVIDNEGFVSFINNKSLSVLGYEKSDITGKNIKVLLREDLSKLSLNKITSELKTRSSVTLELGLYRKDGKRILTEANFTNYNVNGINMGLQAIIRDITQKREMEERIFQSNKELATLNSVSKSLTSTLDIDNLLTLIVEEITGKLNFHSCILGLLDSSGISIQAKALSGVNYSGENMADDFGGITANHDIINRVVNNNEIIRTTEIPENWIIEKINKFESESEKVKELIIAPISVKNKKIGILVVGSSLPAKISDISLISSIANSAAVAIDNATLYDTTRKYFIKTIDALIAAVEAKDTYTEGHSQRVSKFAINIAKKLGLEKEQIEDIKIAGILHDIGKIGISDNILQKNGKLTDGEYEEIKQHPSISNKILFPVGFSDRTLKAIAFHHERYDGKGYPFGLAGNDISIEAQVIAVADAFDAMTSNRSYRDSMSMEVALKELLENKGSQFSPEVVDALIEIINEQEEVA